MEASTSSTSNHQQSDSSNLIEESCYRDFGRKQNSNDNVLPQPIPKSTIKLSVEPVMFLVLFGITMSGNLLTNLLLIRTCEFMKLETIENCTIIVETQSGGQIEKIVQPYVTNLSMYKTIIESFVPAILAFFIGPWCDVYGRRPLLVLTLLGFCFNHILLIGFTWFMLPPMFVLITSIPTGLLGGTMGLYTAVFSYVNDISTTKDLSFRMAIAEASLFLGLLCGNAAVPYLYPIFPSHGFEGVFSISLSFCLSALLYVIFFLPESVTVVEHNLRRTFRALFDHKQVLNLFRVCFGQYDGYSRPIRLILVAVSVLSLLSLEGTLSVTFLFTRNKFSWNLKQFTTFADAALLMNLCGILFGTALFSKLLQMPNEPLSSFAYFLKAVSYVLIAIGDSGWFMYVSSVVGALGGMSGPVNRAILSKTIPKEDIGKLFALLSALYATLPIVAALTYTQLYNSTMNSYPGAVFLLSAALLVFCAVLLGIYNPPSYGLLEENTDQEEQPASS